MYSVQKLKTRYARKLFIGFILTTFITFLVSCSPSPSAEEKLPSQKTAQKIAYYTCSMHPHFKSDKPGDCPICGMRLSPVYVDVSDKKEMSTTSKDEVHLTEEGIRQAGVSVETAQKRKLAKELLIFGTLGYNFNLHRDVVPLVSGRIERQLVDFNQTEVEEGTALVSLYSVEAIALQEEYLKTLRERWLSTFYERGLLTSMIKLAEEKLKRIGYTDEDLEKLQREQKINQEVIIRSPIAGSIVGNMVHIGEMAKTDMPLYHIAPLDELWFNAQVFEPDLSLIELGQNVRISTKSFPGEIFTGRLDYIGRVLDPTNRTIPVRFTMPNKDRRLLPNLSASGELEIPLGEAVLSVPNSAVLDLGTRHVIYVQKQKGAYLSRNVRVGHITKNYTQIVDGIAEGEEVVIGGAFLIDAQSQLRAMGGGEDEIKDRPVIAPPTIHQH